MTKKKEPEIQQVLVTTEQLTLNALETMNKKLDKLLEMAAEADDEEEEEEGEDEEEEDDEDEV